MIFVTSFRASLDLAAIDKDDYLVDNNTAVRECYVVNGSEHSSFNDRNEDAIVLTK